jgi:proteasome accessory factor B
VNARDSAGDPAGAAGRRRVPPEQRQFNLILALLATEQGLTKSDLLSTVAGYAERFDDLSDRENLERQFERDKEDIRELGVPLETVDQPGAEGDTRLQRYRVSRSRYRLPDDIVFSAEEVALLGLAAQVWREGSLTEQSRRALTKLRAFGHAVEQSVIGFAPSIRTREAAHDPLAEAIDRRRQVRFSYLKPGTAEPEQRRVSPLALINHEGRWHLHAHDETVDAPRTFLLSRIVGRVRLIEDAARAPRADEALLAQRELREVHERTTAIVEARAGSEADVVLRNRPGTVEEGGALIVHATDLAVLAEELAAFGADIRVQAPDVVREAVNERWRQVLSSHE